MRKPEITKWIEGLRSGKYKQARNTICDSEQNLCCLGVLAVANDVTKLEDTPNVHMLKDYRYAWSILGYETCTKFQLYNDTDKLNFKQIADKAEEIFPDE